MEQGDGHVFTGPTGPIEHLFWWTLRPLFQPPRTVLYSLGLQIDWAAEMLSYRLYEYSPGDDRTRSCTFNVPTEYRLVKGSTRPNLLFYKEEPDPPGPAYQLP